MATEFDKNVSKYGAQSKSCSLKHAANFHRNVGKTEQHLLCYFFHAGAFANGVN
jgi:hypothetical protein